MLLKDSFYTITKTTVEDNQLEVKLNINANHEIFEGHFPGNPITPGVVQLEILKELLSIYAGKTVQDRKSTRLNSSHVKISYAVFCLKKKNSYFYYTNIF